MSIFNLKNMGLVFLLSVNLVADESIKIDLSSYNKNMDKFAYKMSIDKNKLMIKKADMEIAILAQEKKIYPVVQRIDKINQDLKVLKTLCTDYYNDRKKISKDMNAVLSEKYPNLQSKILNSYTKNNQIQEEELEKCRITQNQKQKRLKQEKQELFEKQDILNIKRSKLQIKLDSINKKIARTEKEISPMKNNKMIPIQKKVKNNEHRPKICLKNKLNIRNVNSPYNVIGSVDEVVDVFDLGERRILKIFNSKIGKDIDIETILIEAVTHRNVSIKGYIPANTRYQRPCI
ncbi:MAG: Unknown protein [uncultured Sulfurovum sp.]|uniref:Uncharacterized protein n=1 Tax=uncultured Sulfurovum sp. TaxID=269237 RepID=A0A6S6SN48_9BACT|nr:MAG: Unknown protein [uncultured Sulfurovum sp.]